MILDIVIILTSMVSAVLTYYINIHLNQGAVRSSAMLSLIVGIIFYFLKNTIPYSYYSSLPVAFIGASFIGMVSSDVLKELRLIAFAGFIFSIIYINTSHFFNGYGGALGTAASISVMATMCIPILIPRRKTINGILIIRKWMFPHKKRRKRRVRKY